MKGRQVKNVFHHVAQQVSKQCFVAFLLGYSSADSAVKILTFAVLSSKSSRKNFCFPYSGQRGILEMSYRRLLTLLINIYVLGSWVLEKKSVFLQDLCSVYAAIPFLQMDFGIYSFMHLCAHNILIKNTLLFQEYSITEIHQMW